MKRAVHLPTVAPIKKATREAVRQAFRAGTGLRTVERIVQATVGSQRRTLRVSDLPLGPEGVAGYAIDIEEMEEQGRAFRATGDTVYLDRAARSMVAPSPSAITSSSANSTDGAPFKGLSMLMRRARFQRVPTMLDC